MRTLAEGAAGGVGARHAIDWQSRAPYLVRLQTGTVSIAAQREIVIRTAGDPDGGHLAVLRFDRRWMRVPSPPLRPFFACNHRAAMAAGAHGLAHRLARACP